MAHKVRLLDIVAAFLFVLSVFSMVTATRELILFPLPPVLTTALLQYCCLAFSHFTGCMLAYLCKVQVGHVATDYCW